MSDELHENPADPTSFMQILDAKTVLKESGHCQLSMTVLDRHLRSLGMLHGGVLAALLDSVMGFSASTVAPADYFVVTVQLSINFIRPVRKGELLFADGQVLHAGQKTCVTRGEVTVENGGLAGTGSATFMFIPHAK